jgi:hypothetical protein
MGIVLNAQDKDLTALILFHNFNFIKVFFALRRQFIALQP